MSFIVPNDNLNEHHCPLAVIKCIDFRFRKSDQEFIEEALGYDKFDLFAWPGSGKEILNDNGFKTSFIEKVVSVSKNLHGVEKLLLLWHWDCGGYGGSKNFSSAEEEEETYKKDLLRAKEILAKELPDDLEIIMAYSRAHPQGLEYIIVE
ncbi:MAG: hypothetical protein COV55_01550 [Candidatus Komeilibacteria bacterium CG11_big_fil_rev_8_21_14_0_20_36_20]|uniref:Carbonic anhydrase n=1 Tax=Candidatus Komeilibacteria bacterium CG11_big_fil_rev_8_21_14_0_20_36_20 TaxID=1974477 RepID=A0A2H0NG11_9BACT|nr:MAG: hypothetical protein COV55_01550 [Candidatus Komeilibacteria bacterium CG11_big_fil_rev_8_21_14_0_20_36_20]PIR81227.1 MAG: hypothetical protein COU21_04535 [Candidatus Komeilibacteria bacterium CG10_big_fil_rev_8_21_14_0_10_36_65]PJC55191.1 MAG: hypothetical protein CO027_03475 [Candidatus Komeilibacteria bacterium CG_4_9_14_0_2_um_filter_36_13]